VCYGRNGFRLPTLLLEAGRCAQRVVPFHELAAFVCKSPLPSARATAFAADGL
jgi:hypothetical protein